MLQSQTAMLEKNTVLTGDFATEPFEVAWSREARWFFQVLRNTDDADVDLVSQISPDGLTWLDLDPSSIMVGEASLTSWSVREYGHWLRLRGRIYDADGADATVQVRIYLALKS